VRQHALLQNRLSETETTRRSGFEGFYLESDAYGLRKNLCPVIARTDQAHRDRLGGHAFRDDGTQIFAAGRLRGWLFLRRRRMHRAAGGVGNRFYCRDRDSSNRTVVREREPRRQRQNHDKKSNRAAPHIDGPSRRLPDWQFPLPPGLVEDASKNVMNRPANRGRKIRWTRAWAMPPNTANARLLDRDDLEGITALSQAKSIVGSAAGFSIIRWISHFERDPNLGDGEVLIPDHAHGIA
jgi:hypothetical protein